MVASFWSFSSSGVHAAAAEAGRAGWFLFSSAIAKILMSWLQQHNLMLSLLHVEKTANNPTGLVAQMARDGGPRICRGMNHPWCFRRPPTLWPG
jgi:hypothetical protein